jgi:hypothetical protein
MGPNAGLAFTIHLRSIVRASIWRWYPSVPDCLHCIGAQGGQLGAHHHSTPPEHQKHKHRHHRSHSSPYSPPLASPCPAPRSSASRRIPMCGMSVSSFDDAAPLGSWQPGSLGTARVSASTSTTRRVNPRIELHSTVQFSRGTVPVGIVRKVLCNTV